MSPFDRALTASCMVTFHKHDASILPFSTHSDLFVKKVANFSYPRVFGAAVGSDPSGFSQRSLASENYSFRASIVAR